MTRIINISALVAILWTGTALAVPETVSVKVTDVSTSSFSIIWMTNVAAEPSVEIYRDGQMIDRITDELSIVSMPDTPDNVAEAARNKGIMKVRVSGLSPDSHYFARTVTRDPNDPFNPGYSPLQEIYTAKAVQPYKQADDGTLAGIANDLITMNIYTPPNDTSLGTGDLLVLELPTITTYPLTAFVGTEAISSEGIIDLNNLFGPDMTTLQTQGKEKALITVYRGDTLITEQRQSLATLTHYRKLPDSSNLLQAQEPVKGFFADINLDGKVDDADFQEFRKQYRSEPDDSIYNPDYNFFPIDVLHKIGAQDFAAFAKEYGKIKPGF